MLTRETMGCLALLILWVNALLIAADVARQTLALLRRRASLAGSWARGRVIQGAGPGGALAARHVDQVGRAAGASSILFHERAARSEVFGGTIALDGAGDLTLLAGAEVEVWLDPRSVASAVACPSAEVFDEVHATAARAKGFERTVTASIGTGDQVFVSSARGQVGGHPQAPGLPVALVAAMDPRALLARRAALGACFLAGELLAAAACTALALRPPLFGPVSTAGGVLGLLFFLLVQPAGVRVRDALLVPCRAPVRGTWTRPHLRAGEPAQPAAE